MELKRSRRGQTFSKARGHFSRRRLRKLLAFFLTLSLSLLFTIALSVFFLSVTLCCSFFIFLLLFYSIFKTFFLSHFYISLTFYLSFSLVFLSYSAFLFLSLSLALSRFVHLTLFPSLAHLLALFFRFLCFVNSACKRFTHSHLISTFFQTRFNLGLIFIRFHPFSGKSWDSNQGLLIDMLSYYHATLLWLLKSLSLYFIESFCLVSMSKVGHTTCSFLNIPQNAKIHLWAVHC